MAKLLNMKESKPSRRRWLRFSLRTMLLLVIAVAMPIAWVAKERRQSRYEWQIAERLQELGFGEIRLGGPYEDLERRSQGKTQERWRDAARDILGERVLDVSSPDSKFNDLKVLASLRSVQWLYLGNTRVDDATPLVGFKRLEVLWLDNTRIADLEALVGLTNLRQLHINSTKVSDLMPLTRLGKLEILWLDDTEVSDLTPLARLTNLKALGLSSTPVTTLTPLAGLKNLTSLRLKKCNVTKEQVEALQRAIPKCAIDHDPFP